MGWDTAGRALPRRLLQCRRHAVHARRVARLIRGKLVAEIGELRGLQSRAQESIKEFISKSHDRWVPKYQERKVTVARRLVFVATTNHEEFLTDETGNRRWLPVRVGKVNR